MTKPYREMESADLVAAAYAEDWGDVGEGADGVVDLDESLRVVANHIEGGTAGGTSTLYEGATNENG